MWGAKSGTPEGDRLDVLATLIDAYEAEHYPMDPPDPVEAIKFRMEQQGLSRKDLEPLIGTRTRVAEVLNRKRDGARLIDGLAKSALSSSSQAASVPKPPPTDSQGEPIPVNLRTDVVGLS